MLPITSSLDPLLIDVHLVVQLFHARLVGNLWHVEHNILFEVIAGIDTKRDIHTVVQVNEELSKPLGDLVSLGA